MSHRRIVLPSFRAACEALGYRPKSVFFSELFLFLRECDDRRIDVVIESGVKFGGSTQVLAATFWGRVISIDRSFLPEFRRAAPLGVRLVQGEAAHEIPRLLQALNGQRVAVLIDGPKGERALALKDQCLQVECVQLVAVHDVAAGLGELRHSTESTFRRYYGRALDQLLPADMQTKYPFGPGLGLWGRA